MTNKKIFLRQRKQQIRLSKSIFTQYLLSLVLMVAVYFTAVGLFIISYRTFWMFRSSSLHGLYDWLSLHRVDISLVVLSLGWLILTYRCIYRALSYLDDLVAASEQMVQQPERAVELPPLLKAVQDEMNLTREQSLRNALLAKEAEQRKQDMLVYLAHDLKTPLTSVIGYLTLLQEEPQISTELRARYTNIALEKAQRLELLINEFFEISRFHLTELTLERQRIHFSRMLEQITYEFQPILEEQQLHWRLQIAPDVQILGDADKLERVLDNLIRNAVYYSETNSEIALTLRADEAGITLTITNRGCTLTPEQLEHIFEHFFRVDASRNSNTGGAGLGLAIVKELVELHGGNIDAASEKDTITFTVWLPSV